MIISEIWFFVVIFMKFMFIELWSGRLNCFRASFSCFACIFSDLSFFTITFWIFRVLFSSSCARNMIFVFRSVILCVRFDRSDFHFLDRSHGFTFSVLVFLSWISVLVYLTVKNLLRLLFLFFIFIYVLWWCLEEYIFEQLNCVIIHCFMFSVENHNCFFAID